MTKELLLITLAVFIGFAGLLSCNGMAGEEPRGEGEGQAAPEHLRDLGMEHLPDATRELRLIWQDPFGSAPRRRLAELYLKAGYRAVGEFFETTAELVSGEVPELSLSGTATGWLYPGSEAGRPSDPAVVREVLERTLSGRSVAAVEQAERAIEERGISPQLAAAWSYAVLWQVATTNDDVEEDRVELALRLYITVLEETPAHPPGATSKAESYEMLGNFFAALEDLPSAYLADTLALRYLEREEGASAEIGIRHRLEERRRQVVDLLGEHLEYAPADVELGDPR